jgi:hypothetical protein
MRQVLIIVILLTVTDLCGQTTLNRLDRSTKNEFVELTKSRDEFVPTDIKWDTVVIVKYTVSDLEHLHRCATLDAL